MPTKAAYSETLDRLAKLLKRKPMTAKAISAEIGRCRPVAYQLIKALRRRGDAVYELAVRESVTGPTSTAYGLR
jgi:hypothetical protein